MVSCKLTVQISLSTPPSISFRFLICRLQLPSASSSSDGFTELSSIQIQSYTGWSNSRLLLTISATCWRTPFCRLMMKVYDSKNYYVTRKGSHLTSAQSSFTEIYGVRYSLLSIINSWSYVYNWSLAGGQISRSGWSQNNLCQRKYTEILVFEIKRFSWYEKK